MESLLARLVFVLPFLLFACIEDGDEYPNPYVWWDTGDTASLNDTADTGDTATETGDTDTATDTGDTATP